MIKRLLHKLSAALLKAHNRLDSRLQVDGNFKRRTVRYPVKRGSRKIVHVIGNFIVGGSSQLVVDIIEGTSDEYYHEIVVPQLDSRLGYEVRDIHAFGITQLRELTAWLADERPELVHIHYFVRDCDRHSDGALWYETIFKICEDLGLKVIQNVNVPTRPHRNTSVVHNVFVSEYVRREFNDVGDVESSVIYPGSDFEHFRNDIDSLPEKAIGMVYRLDQDKLRSDAIEVFIAVVKLDPAIRALIVGGGYFLEDFKRRVSDERLDEKISFGGLVSYDRLPEMYRRFSIFVAPVHEESFGQVTPFAMGMGMCVAGYNTGAIPEILGSGETLAPTGDVDALARIIVDIANDPERRKRIGAENRRRAVENFSVGPMVDRYRTLYADVLGVRQADRR